MHQREVCGSAIEVKLGNFRILLLVFQWTGHPVALFMAVPFAMFINDVFGQEVIFVSLPGNMFQADPFALAGFNIGFGTIRLAYFRYRTRRVGFWISMNAFVEVNMWALSGLGMFFILLYPIEGNMFGFFVFPALLIGAIIVGAKVASMADQKIQELNAAKR